MRRSRLIFVAALFLLLHLSACTHLLPLRTSASAATCDSDKDGDLIAAGRPGYDEECASTAHERTADYDLLFVEFDDQGLLYPPTAQDRRRQFQVGPQQFEAAATETRDADAGSAGIQIGLTLSRLQELARADPSTHDGLSILVYVHGWKHNAAADDDDVKGFRKALKTIALVERARIRLARQNGNRTALPRRAVGIYVGWRGTSLPWHLKHLTFYDRMTVAHHVAVGQARELFVRLKGFQAAQNEQESEQDLEKRRIRTLVPPRQVSAKPTPSERQDDPARKVRMILVGHSFGALILFNATSASLIESLVRQQGPDGVQSAYGNRVGDLVVLINPAFEATRYVPLHRLAHDARYAYDRYSAPILVSVTSTADLATKIAFPIGRFFGTLFESTSSADESRDIRQTIGHLDPYITHELEASGKVEPCDGWVAPEQARDTQTPQKLVETMANNLVIEARKLDDFVAKNLASGKLAPKWQRDFCGGSVLRHLNFDANSVIWNVRATRSIIPGHNDIQGPVLSHFFRQVYGDTETYAFERPRPNR